MGFSISLPFLTEILCSFVLAGFVYYVIHIYSTVLLRSQRAKQKLRMQGITGPSPSFLYGNLPEMQRIQMSAMKTKNHGEIVAHDYSSTVFPHFEHWRKEFGLIYTYSTGSRQHLYINDPELVKEMNQSITLDLGKPSYLTKRFETIFGNGIVRSNGHFWAQQRKIIAPEFFMDKVKAMTGLIVDSTQPLLARWEGHIEAQGGVQADINVEEDLRGLSADVISRASFGSSYVKGRAIFSKLRTLQKTVANQNVLFGFTSYGLYTRKNKKDMSDLEREVNSLIWETVKERKQQCLSTGSVENDLMQQLLEEAVNATSLGMVSPKRFIIDNCKSIYFAGHDSTATAASWCLMLLALHPEWQSRVRAEAQQFCKNGLVDTNSLPNLKMVTMVVQEALRLYPPAAFVSREALEDVQIGNITVPKGVCIWTLIPTLHRDPYIWGPDANEFRPDRFANGVSKACKFPQAYIPFGLGTRLCLGRNLAMVELKIFISLIISKFMISLSPNYRHSPTFRMLVEPEHGLQIVIRKF